MMRNILVIVNLGKLQRYAPKKMFLAKAFTYFLNKQTEAEEEESSGANKFPGSENCILSQALTLRGSNGNSAITEWQIFK